MENLIQEIRMTYFKYGLASGEAADRVEALFQSYLSSRDKKLIEKIQSADESKRAKWLFGIAYRYFLEGVKDERRQVISLIQASGEEKE